jgi:hypothetical protein
MVETEWRSYVARDYPPIVYAHTMYGRLSHKKAEKPSSGGSLIPCDSPRHDAASCRRRYRPRAKSV